MTELATASLEVPQTGSSSAMGAQAAPAAPRKRRAPAGLKCGECGKRFGGPRAASRLGAHKYSKHTRAKAQAPVNPADADVEAIRALTKAFFALSPAAQQYVRALLAR